MIHGILTRPGALAGDFVNWSKTAILMYDAQKVDVSVLKPVISTGNFVEQTKEIGDISLGGSQILKSK